ncbi:hypothetical protein BDP27DRAFT_1370293 [Rhodocollybia butyracea]|uniref:Uncharacterized protein n=1 Tax=Rhodocollybia butyracea TaxID=206335 RepID=A0A9P5P9C8_9AGAR|nr:hypothetical protein BDP27DRAFT_1370293 [Rhodocollybia butyracea]
MSEESRAIKRFGAAVVKGVDVILYRLRLTQIECILREGSHTTTNLNLKARKRLYIDLFELSRSVYSVSIRTRALRLIMRKIGQMDLKDITVAIVHQWSSKRQDDLREMLKEMLFCIRMYREPRLMPNVLDALRDDGLAKLISCHLVGLNAYGHGIPEFAGSLDILSTAEFRAPFLKLLRLIVSLSTSPTISRALLGLGILEFIIETSFQEAGPRYENPGESLLQAILGKLDPIQDIHSIPWIQEVINHRVMKLSVRPTLEFKSKKEAEIQRLSAIENILQNKDSGAVTDPNFKTQELYSDLLEWSCPGHSVLTRARAFRLIMHKIGRSDSEDLATAIVCLPSSDCQNLLWDMFFCIRIYKGTRLMSDVLRNASAPFGSLTAYYLAGLDAYSHEACGFPQQEVDVPVARAVFRTPFLMSLRSMVMLSTSPIFSRVLLGLEILEFILETSFQEVGSQYEGLGLSLLQVILEKLDPVQDIYYISQIQPSIDCRV